MLAVGQWERKPIVGPGLVLVVSLLLAGCGGGGGSGSPVRTTPTLENEPSSPTNMPARQVATVPSSPGEPTVSPTQGTTDSLDISWIAPADDGNSAITAYHVQYRKGTTGPWNDWLHTGTTTSTTITGLEADTSYQVKVCATNAEGTSEWSATGTGQTNASADNVVEAPSGSTSGPGQTNAVPQQTSTGSGQTNTQAEQTDAPANDAPTNLGYHRNDPVMVLRWRAPRISGGGSILRYEYRIDGGNWQQADGTATSYVFHNLQAGTTYRFQVRAVIVENGVERNSSPSAKLSASPHPQEPGDLPGAPGNLRANAGDGQILLTWTAPDPGVGEPDPGQRYDGAILYYLYQVSGVWRPTHSRTSTSQLVTGLVNGQSYTFKVKAVTQYHISPTSTVSATPRAATAPDKPTQLTATRGSDGYTTLIWHAPVWNGGAEITSFEYKKTGGTWQTLDPANEAGDNACPYRCRHTASLQGLAEGDSVQVRARNRVGPGDASAAARVRVAGLSVDDAETQEAEGAVIAFTVRLNRTDLTSKTITVAYATSDGTATAGSDYTETSGTLTFGLGDTAKTITVPVLNDETNENAETFTLTLSNATGASISDGTATGTITNSDPLPTAWLARFGRTVGTHVTDAVSDRVRGAASSSSHLTVAGYRLPLGQRTGATDTEADRLALGTALTRLTTGPEAAWPGYDPGGGRTINLRDLLAGSSFRLALGADDGGHSGPLLTAWGRVAGTQFNGQESTLALDGDVLTGTLGLDGVWDRWLAGVAVAHSRGNGAFTGTGGPGDMDTALTSIHPYLRYAVTERLDVWGLLGYGWGELTLDPDNAASMETDTDLVMGAFGGRGILLAASESGGFEIATRTDAMLTRTTSDAVTGAAGNMAAAEADAHRLRLVLEGSRHFTWTAGRSLSPSMELGIRHDWGDAETGFGLELGGRVRYADPARGLTVEGAVRGLLAHEDNDYGEWGASGTLRIAPGFAGQGLSVTLAPTWGAAASGVEGLWSRQTTAGSALQGTRRAPTGRLAAEVGYGLTAFGTGRLTPYAGTVVADGADRVYRVGTRLHLTGRRGTALTLNLQGRQQEQAGQQPLNQEILLRATWGF